MGHGAAAAPLSALPLPLPACLSICCNVDVLMCCCATLIKTPPNVLHFCSSTGFLVNSKKHYTYRPPMANAASKKASKAQASASTKYLPYICVVSLIFVVFRLVLSEFLVSNIITLIVYSVTYVVSYFGLVEATKNNSAGEYYFDAFCVNMFSQLMYSFFTWGWYIWYIIPGYAVYQAVMFYLRMKSPALTAGTSGTDGTDEVDKGRDKKEKKNRAKMQKIH
jgi:hypothetical protein